MMIPTTHEPAARVTFLPDDAGGTMIERPTNPPAEAARVHPTPDTPRRVDPQPPDLLQHDERVTSATDGIPEAGCPVSSRPRRVTYHGSLTGHHGPATVLGVDHDTAWPDRYGNRVPEEHITQGLTRTTWVLLLDTGQLLRGVGPGSFSDSPAPHADGPR